MTSKIYFCIKNDYKNNNNMDFYIAHTPEIKINPVKNIKKHTCNIILNVKVHNNVIGKNVYK